MDSSFNHNLQKCGDKKIQMEMNGKCNAKNIHKLKRIRERNIGNYSEISNKLNELNNG